MAAIVQQTSQKSTEEKMENLKIDPSKDLNTSNMAPPKQGVHRETKSHVSSAGNASKSFTEASMDHGYVAMYQTSPYPMDGGYGYYYSGYDGYFVKSDDQEYYSGGYATGYQYPVVQTENGSLVYLVPGYQAGYSPYIPVNNPSFSGQHLNSPSSTLASSGYFQDPVGYGELIPSTYMWDPSLFVVDGVYGTAVADTRESKSNLSSTLKKVVPSTLNDSLGSKTLDASSRNPPGHLKASSKASRPSLTCQPSLSGKGCFPIAKIPFFNQAKGRTVCSDNNLGYKTCAQGCNAAETLKGRNKINDASEFASINGKGETVGPLPIDKNEKSANATSLVTRDQYNLADFPTKYDDALFFVIKSYSEDNIHKSIKYNVWASTLNGNIKLNNAYQDAQKRMAEKGGKCPVFLFFSVNASGQFCGVAEMTERVNFDKSMDFWQEDKWNSYFPVKWHIIKDIPNPQLRHIILEHNDFKPVTNSRDTQEIGFSQGIEMLNIFKKHESKTSILDDFDFYESREKVMLEKKTRSPKSLS